jgi:hypothetical protein
MMEEDDYSVCVDMPAYAVGLPSWEGGSGNLYSDDDESDPGSPVRGKRNVCMSGVASTDEDSADHDGSSSGDDLSDEYEDDVAALDYEEDAVDAGEYEEHEVPAGEYEEHEVAAADYVENYEDEVAADDYEEEVDAADYEEEVDAADYEEEVPIAEDDSGQPFSLQDCESVLCLGVKTASVCNFSCVYYF